MNFKLNYFLFMLLLLQIWSVPIYSQTLNYEGRITFIASSRFGKVNGEFKKVKFVVPKDKIGSQVIVDVGSISTGNSLRDNHLREEDFFYVEKYPQAVFTITSLNKVSEKSFQCTGILTIRGQKKELTLFLNLEKLPNSHKYFGEVEINRTDFGINYNSFINPISEKVLVQYEVFEKFE